MTNAQIASLLRNIAAAYSIQDESKFRFQIIAYQKAADTIENLSTQVIDLYKEHKLNTIPGVGPSLQRHFEELFQTGRVKHFDNVLKEIPEAMFPLLAVPSFGPKKAYKLVTEFHLNNPKTVLDDIEKIAKQGKIADLAGFGDKSQQDILRAIDDFRYGKGKTTRMVLPFAAEIAEKIVSYLKQSKDVVDAKPLGSLRRMAPTIGDVDIAVATNRPKRVIDHFANYPYKERMIEKGEETASLLTSGGKQVDLMTQPVDSFGSLLQHFTGSKNHNVALREFALRKGLSLSEHGIKEKRSGKEVMRTVKTEEEFYKVLGLDWIPPEIRDNNGEIELALKHKLPKLVEVSDIKGDLHIHSNFAIEPSHDLGRDSIEDIVNRAIELGYEYIGFSEHNPSISKHSQNQVYSLISKRNERIEHINKSNKNIRVIKLLETDILVNGELAINNKCLEILDATIVSIHSSFDTPKEEMTKRVLQGLSHPKAKILAHPTGRLLNSRPGYDLEWDTIFEFCKKHNKALEINAWPQRLDLPDNIVKKAVEKGVKLVIDTDSHALAHMGLMRYGVSVARRGWCTKDDILNTLTYNKFIEWIKS